MAPAAQLKKKEMYNLNYSSPDKYSTISALKLRYLRRLLNFSISLLQPFRDSFIDHSNIRRTTVSFRMQRC